MSDAPALRTWLTERLGFAVPVVCAPMAGVDGGRLAAAVYQAGALGMIGVGPAATSEWITAQCAIAAATGKPFGVGLLAWAVAEQPAQLDAVIASRPALVSVSFGPYAPFVESLQRAGSLVATQVGNLSEARGTELAGVDLRSHRPANLASVLGDHGIGDAEGVAGDFQAVAAVEPNQCRRRRLKLPKGLRRPSPGNPDRLLSAQLRQQILS